MAWKSIAVAAKELEKYIEDRRAGLITSCKTGYPKLDESNLDGFEYGTTVTIGGRPSIGKCLGKGTEIIMFDGSLKKVEDIQTGDLLMGPDSTFRTVLSTCKGRDLMYTVHQRNGISYRTNSAHILSLKRGKTEKKQPHGRVKNIAVSDYIKWPVNTQKRYKGYMSEALDFPEKEVPIDPYYLGLWLGDGTERGTDITTKDCEIVNFLQEYSDELGLFLNKKNPDNRCESYAIRSRIGKGKSLLKGTLLNKLQEANLIENKHIPNNYIINSKENRLKLLAGLIDSDGHVNKTGAIEITLKSKELLEQIKFLCNTLGYRVSLKEKKGSIKATNFRGTYYRVVICGNGDEIPLKISRKKERLRKKSRNSSMTCIKVEENGYGDYFGFVLDGDHLFLLKDCTVTHNTAYSSCLLRGIMKNNDIDEIAILDFNWEMSSRALLLRDLSADMEVSYRDLISAGKEKITDERMQTIKAYIEAYKDLPVYFEEEPKTTKEFADAVRRKRDALKGKKLIVRIDHSILAKRSPSEASQVEMLHNLLFESNIIKKESDVLFIFLTQINRVLEERQEDGTDRAFPLQGDVYGGDATAMFSETMILLNRPSKYGITYYGRRPSGVEPQSDEIFAHCVKNRNAPPDLVIRYKSEFNIMKMTEK